MNPLPVITVIHRETKMMINRHCFLICGMLILQGLFYTNYAQTRRTHLRGSLQMSITGGYSQTKGFAINSFYIYQAYLQHENRSFHVRIGRFYNRYEPYSRFWDGLLVHYGTRGVGAGLAAGFLPRRSIEIISFQRPRFSLFTHAEKRLGTLRVGSDLSFHQIRPSAPLRTHQYIGWSTWMRTAWMRASSEWQLDRDPESKHWRSSRVYLRGTFHPTQWFSFHLRYQMRQYYSIWRSTNFFSPLRQQIALGLTIEPSIYQLSILVARHYYQHQLSGTSYTLGLHTGKIPLLQASWNTSLGAWQNTLGNSRYLSTSLTRSFRKLRLTIGYQWYHSQLYEQALTTHQAVFHLSLPVYRRIRWDVHTRLQGGSHLRQIHLYSRISVPFR